MPHPTPASAYGIWTLNEVRDSVRGENWPPLVYLQPNTWKVDSPLTDLERIRVNNIEYTGANITLARVTSLLENTNFQDTSITDATRSYYSIYFGSTSGESISFLYNASGATSVTIRLQRYSGTDVNYTLSGDVTGTGTATTSSSTITSNCPSSGTITITTNNNSLGLSIYAIQFNNKSPGDLTYV